MPRAVAFKKSMQPLLIIFLAHRVFELMEVVGQLIDVSQLAEVLFCAEKKSF